jgi:hypothetical protein
MNNVNYKYFISDKLNISSPKPKCFYVGEWKRGVACIGQYILRLPRPSIFNEYKSEEMPSCYALSVRMSIFVILIIA